MDGVQLSKWLPKFKWLQSHRGGSLLFITKLPEIPGTHLIDFGRMKG